jgi:hypothetical protein
MSASDETVLPNVKLDAKAKGSARQYQAGRDLTVHEGADDDIEIFLHHEINPLRVDQDGRYDFYVTVCNYSRRLRKLELSANIADCTTCEPQTISIGANDRCKARVRLTATATAPIGGRHSLRVDATEIGTDSTSRWKSNEWPVDVKQRAKARIIRKNPFERVEKTNRYRGVVRVRNSGNTRLVGDVGPRSRTDNENTSAVTPNSLLEPRILDPKWITADSFNIEPKESSDVAIEVHFPTRSWLNQRWSTLLEPQFSQTEEVAVDSVKFDIFQVGIYSTGIRTLLDEAAPAFDHLRVWGSKQHTLPRWILAFVALSIVIVGIFIGSSLGGGGGSVEAGQRVLGPMKNPTNDKTAVSVSSTRSAIPATAVSTSDTRMGLQIQATDLNCNGEWISVLALFSSTDSAEEFFDRAYYIRFLLDVSYAHVEVHCAGLKLGDWVLYAGPFSTREQADRIGRTYRLTDTYSVELK